MRRCQGNLLWVLVTVIVLTGLIQIYTKETAVHNEDQVSSRADVPSVQQFSFKGASQDNPDLIDYIRREMLDSPSPHKYNLRRPKTHHYSQLGQSLYADTNFLHGMRDGFFIEVGAVDGEHLSNSLFFEKDLGWRGLLIEPNPDVYKILRSRNRKAYSVNAALSPSTNATDVTFNKQGRLGELGQISKTGITVQALPLFSILRALDIEFVDFFSLDIESFEVKVLKTLPWDRVKFRLMCIEVKHIPEGLEYLIEFLKEKGYVYLGKKSIDAWFGWPGLYNVTIES